MTLKLKYETIKLLITIIPKNMQETKSAPPPAPQFNVSVPPGQIVPVNTAVAAPSKKFNKGCCLGCGIVSCLGFIFLVALMTFIPFFLPPGFVPLLFSQLIGKNFEDIQRIIPGNKETFLLDNEKQAKTSDSFSKITLPANSNLSLTAVNKNQWPTGTVGGLYKIEPSGQFSEVAQFTIALNSNPGRNFGLGYWHADTNKWEYIPTVRLFGNVYEGVIAHASEVGGYLPGLEGSLDYQPTLIEADEKATWQALITDLRNLVQKQKNGFAISENDPTWPSVKRNLKWLAENALNDCKIERGYKRQMDYMYFWGLSQLLGIKDVDAEMAKDWDKCLPKANEGIATEYVVDEIQTIKNDANVPGFLNTVYEGNMDADGMPVRYVKPGEGYAWQTDWQVVDRTEYKANVSFNWEQQALNSYINNNDWNTWDSNVVTNIYIFSLKNLKVGDKFSMRGVSIGDAPSYYRNYRHVYRWFSSNLSEEQPAPVPGQPDVSKQEKRVFEVKGTLLEDLGKDGAVIQYGGADSYTDEQKKQLAAIGEIFKDSSGNSQLGQLQQIPAYFMELSPVIKLHIKRSH